jgi:carboxyl-terminal processing protease
MIITKKNLIIGATTTFLSVATIVGASFHFSTKSQAFFRDSPKELVDEVWQVINRQYVDATFNQVDWRQVRNDYLDRNYQDKEEAYKAIREMLEKLGDPYTRFMDPEEYRNMQIDTSGELTGVGIQITKDEESDRLIIVAPIEDTPAFEAGLLSKDIIMKIDGKDTKGMDVNEAVKMIRGKPGTQVTLTIKRNNTETDYTVTRAMIELHPVKARLEDSSMGKIGYIRLTQFSAQAAQEMRQAIENFEKQQVNGYILDLRSNPGGLLGASVEISRMWIDDGTIVSTVNRVGTVDEQKANQGALSNKPLVVLVDGGSASASEIVSGALQDHKRATIIGTKTFGKGLVQSVRGLGDGSGLAVTIAKYLTPNGRDINKLGIEPDIVYELSEQQRKDLQGDRTLIGTVKDPQFAKALEVISKQLTVNSKR